MALKLANNATSRLAVAISASDTTVIVQAGDGAKFPSLSAGDWFPITILRSDNTREIVYATAISGDAITVQRGRENTAAMSFSLSDRVEMRTTVGVLNNFLSREGGTINGTITVQDAATPTRGFVYLGNSGKVLGYNGTDYVAGTDKLWHAGNLTPGNYAPLAGATFTGKVTGATTSMSMSADSGTTQGSFVCRATGTGDANLAGLSFYNDTYAIKMGVRADGTFGIGGWSRSAWSWYSDPSGNMVSAGNVSAYSDPRLKDDVERIDGALALLHQLDGVRFTWNDRTKLIGRPGARDIGVLADQVEAVLPEIVSRSIPDEENGGERWRVVDYQRLVPVLIEAVKELAGRVAALEG